MVSPKALTSVVPWIWGPKPCFLYLSIYTMFLFLCKMESIPKNCQEFAIHWISLCCSFTRSQKNSKSLFNTLYIQTPCSIQIVCRICSWPKVRVYTSSPKTLHRPLHNVTISMSCRWIATCLLSYSQLEKCCAQELACICLHIYIYQTTAVSRSSVRAGWILRTCVVIC